MAERKEVPRWKRKKPPAGPVIHMGGREAKKLAREMGRAQAAALQAGALTGQVVQPAKLPVPGVLARTGAYRYRLHLVPFEWLAGVTAAGLAFHKANALPAAFLTALCAAAAIVAL